MMNPDVIHSLAAEAASAVEPIKAKMAGSVPVERSSQRATNEVEPNKQKKSKQLRISFASGDADGSLALKRQKIVADVS